MEQSKQITTIEKLRDINLRMASTSRAVCMDMVLIKQSVGYLIDSAVQTNTGGYMVPADSIEDLKRLCFDKRRDVS